MHVDGSAVAAVRTDEDVRALMPKDCTLLGRYQSDQVSFLAARFGASGALKSQRSVVHLRSLKTTLVMDWMIPGSNLGPWQWIFDPPTEAESRVLASDPWLVAVSQRGGRHVELIREIDLTGVRVEDWYVWFHRDVTSAQSAISFLLDKGEDANFLITGMAPGAWEVWLDGWLQESPLRIRPETGAAYWRGARGSYFLRRLARS